MGRPRLATTILAFGLIAASCGDDSTSTDVGTPSTNPATSDPATSDPTSTSPPDSTDSGITTADDADPVHAAKGASLVKFLNTGQACISPNRIYVQRGIADQFLATLAERVSKMRAGVGTTEGVSIGPLVDEPSVAKVEFDCLR